METLKFKTQINAPKEKVWDVLWGKESYPKWTAVFMEGSDVVTDWQEGGSILFTDGSGSGMYGIIEKKVPNTQMTFKHLGMLKDGVEQKIDDETKSWSGSIEEYLLDEQNGVTELKVSVDVTKEHVDSFQRIFPKALDKVKELTEH